MNKKISKLIISLGVISMFLFSCHITSSLLIKPVYAEENKETDKKEDNKENTKTKQEEQAETSGCNSYVTQEERDQCVKDRTSGLTTPDFYTTAIMSLDSSIASTEVNQNYIKNFSNSSSTALVYDLSLFDGDTILMHIINIFISLFEMIGQLISLIVMIVYNVASSSFWETIIQGALDIFDKAIFNWGDPNSWFMKILFLFGSLAVANRLMQTKGQIFTIKTILQTVTQVVVSCMMIVFIAQYGRGIIGKVETMATSSVVQSFNILDSQYDSSLPLEVNVKSQIFDIMQKQGFVLRHFGVTSASQISSVNSGDYDSGDKGNKINESNETRVQRLLDDPSKDNAAKERKEYGNTQIAYNSGRCLVILGISIVFLVHRFFMAILIGGASFILLGVGVFKEITIATSTYGLVLMLFRKDKKIAGEWFLGRMKWLIAFILSSLIFNVLLSFIVILINGISCLDVSLLIILPIDIVLVFAMVYAVKNAPELWQKFNAKFDPEDNGIINIAKGIVGGNITPMDMYNRFKDNSSSVEANSGEVSNSNSENETMSSVKDRSDLAETEDLEESENTEEITDSSDNKTLLENDDLEETPEVNEESSENTEEITDLSDNKTLLDSDDDLEETPEVNEELSENTEEITDLSDNKTLLDSDDDLEETPEVNEESSENTEEITDLSDDKTLSDSNDDLEKTPKVNEKSPENTKEIPDSSDNKTVLESDNDLGEISEVNEEKYDKLEESFENIDMQKVDEDAENNEIDDVLESMDIVKNNNADNAGKKDMDVELRQLDNNAEEEKEKQIDQFMEDIWDE